MAKDIVATVFIGEGYEVIDIYVNEISSELISAVKELKVSIVLTSITELLL